VKRFDKVFANKDAIESYEHGPGVCDRFDWTVKTKEGKALVYDKTKVTRSNPGVRGF
jgi:hypothetical protein